MGKEQELLEAARTGNVALVEKLLSGKKGILGSSSGSIPLSGGGHIGDSNGPLSLGIFSMWKGLNVNCTDSSGYTPLHHASLNGHREVVLKLLQFEASTNVADSKGCFPLHLAAWRGDVDIVRILIHHGPSHCRVNQQNHERETALHCAAQYGHSDVVSVLLQELTDPTMRNSRQETPLDLAALYGRLQVVCMLVSAHPNLMTSHTRRHTPLHLAARNGHHSTVQTLLEAGMDVNCVTENGSALHEAALFGKMDVVRLLLDSGIDTNLRDSQGRTALEILREHPAPKSQQITALIQGKTHTHTHTHTHTECISNWVIQQTKNGAFMYSKFVLPYLFFSPISCLFMFCCLLSICSTLSKHIMRLCRECNFSNLKLVFLLSKFISMYHCLTGKFYANTMNMCISYLFDRMQIVFFCVLFADEGSYQRDPPPPPCTSSTSSTVLEDRRKSHIPEEFAGLLHGSSPACETPDTPYHLYSHKARKYGSTDIQSTLLQTPEFSIVIGGGPTQIFSRTERDSSAQRTTNDPQKPQVVYRTIFHTRVNQDQARPRNCAQVDPPPRGWATLDRPPSYSSASSSGQNGEATELLTGSTGKDSSSGTGYEERACTLGRMRSMPRSVLDLQLSKSLSKSDSNLRLPLHPLIGPRCPLQSVGQWLDSIGLVQYENHLLANGFDNVQFMGSNVVEDQDLLEIGILNSAHRQRLLQAIRLLPRVRPVGYDGNNPTSVAEWLESLELGDYTKSFLINGYTSMELVKKIWEIELINVLKISLIGHRKRILASLGDRLHEDIPQKPPRAISLRVSGLNEQTANNLCQYGIHNPSLDVMSHLVILFDPLCTLTCNWLSFQAGEWCEPITLRPPNEATSSTPVQYWQHHPEKLIFQSCDYEAYYLGSMLVKELRGTESTQDACAKMRKSTEQMKKVPTIVLSVSYKGVKFIDATNKNIIAEHEIRNISCAAQDPEDLSTFAYITKDLKSSHHYCHVFTAFDVNLAYEIILTLGQAFEVAYQLALQARKSGHGSSTLPESFDSKPSKPVPKPRVNIRKTNIKNPHVEDSYTLQPKM
uniref:Ankyrin repeat and sterile alpha motif domain containing 1B n=1 Tax=Sphaeramia orbicularis TaxID=375764 RepID=A0A673AK11_9TELE